MPHFVKLSQRFGFILFLLGVTAGLNTLSLAAKEDRWEPTIQKFEKQDKAKKPTPGGIMFLGSSSIRLWNLKKSFPDRDLINRGFGGSEISDSLYYFDRIVMPHRPRLIVGYMGGNDICRGESPKEVVGDFKKFVETLHEKLPKTRLVYLSIKPSKGCWEKRDAMREANRQICKICEKDPLVEFVDMEQITVGPDGKPRTDLFLKDQIHFNDKGYRELSKLVKPFLK